MKKTNLFVKTLGLFALIIASSLGVLGQSSTTVSNQITGQITNLLVSASHNHNVDVKKVEFYLGNYGATTTNYATIPDANLVVKINNQVQANSTLPVKSMISAPSYPTTLVVTIELPITYNSTYGDIISIELKNMLVNPAPQAPYLFQWQHQEANGSNIQANWGNYFIYGPPTISSFSPTSLYPGQTTTIIGTEFNGATSVKFNGVNATSYSIVSNTSITAVAPTGLSAGTISVTTPYGTANSSAYTVISTPPLTLKITSVSPMAAPTGTTVTISGTGFSTTASNNVVYFGGVKAIPSVASATSLTVSVPTGATSGKISVVNLTDKIQVSSTTDFIVSYANPINVTPMLVQKGSFSLSSAITLSTNQTTVESMNIAVADFNEDGKVDILLPANASGANLFLNTSTGINSYSFSTPITLTGDGTSDYTMVATGDFDNDGRIDAIIGSGNNVVIHLNKIVNGNLTFLSNQFNLAGLDRLRVGDVNNDGKLDIIGSGYFTSTIVGLLNTSTTSLSFSTTQTFATGLTYSRSLAIGDMNNDGYLDLMLARDGSVSSPDITKVFINNGLNGIVSFTNYDATNFSGTADAYAYTLDVNGDGNNDLLMGRGNYNNMFIYQNSYNGSSFSGSNLSTYTWLQPQWGGPTTRNNSFGDLNGDGKVDLVQGGSTNSYILLNSTSPLGSTYTYNTLVKTIANPIITAVADFDLNGINDIFYLDPSLGNGSFHELSTAGLTVTNTGTAFYACPGGYDEQVQTATLNATGLTADLVVTAASGYEVSLTQNSGFGSSITIPFGNGTLTNQLVYYRTTSANTTGLSGSLLFESNSATLYTLALTSTVIPAPAMAQFGNGLNFDGTNDYVNVTTNASLNLTSQITIEAWVYRTANNVWQGIAGNLVNGGASYGYQLLIDNQNKVYFQLGQSYNNWSAAQGATSIPLNQWTHIVGTYDATLGSGQIKVYVNGVLDANGSNNPKTWGGPVVNSANIMIGRRPDGNPMYYTGTIDEVRIWNVARSVSEISTNKDIELTGTESGLVAYYKFNQGIANGDNTAISMVTSSTGTNNGSLVSFTKNGSTSNFIAVGESISGPTTATVTSTNTYSHSNTVSSWSVSDPSLASINSSGVLTVLGTGSLNVIADYVVNNCTYQSTYAINTIYTTVSASPSSLSGFAVCEGTASTNQSISVDGVGLNSDITVTAPSGYEISTVSNGTYSQSLTLTQTGGVVNATTIYVRLTGASAGTPSGNLTVASTGATTVNVALTGTVNANPSLSITSPAAVCSPATVDLTAAAVTNGSTGVNTLGYFTNASATTILSTPSGVSTSGTYYIKATSVDGCTDIESVTATINTPLTSAVIAVDNMPCGSSATGSATVTLTGGTSPYTYSWTRNGVAYTATPAGAPTNLSSGTYIATVTDACGSVTSNSIVLTNSPSLTLNSAVLGANALCNGGNGSIVGVIQGGTSPRTLTVTNTTNNTLVYTSSVPSGSPSAGQFQFTVNVPAGTYTVSASDAVSSCVSTSNTNITVTEPAVLSATTSKTDVCYGGTNGTITVTATGGTGTKTYSHDGGATYQSSNIFTGLAAGAYSIVVKDANNCTTTPVSVTINQSGSALAVGVTTVTNATCNSASTGGVNITATGGYNTAYTYAWTGPSSFTATTEDLTNRPAGVYNVTVTDAGGCTATATATITEPTALTATVVKTNVLCNGGSTGTITITSAAGGTPSYQYSIDGGTSWQSSASITGLVAGTYNVQIKDANNCISDLDASSNTVITQPVALSATNVISNVLCNGGSTGWINITTTGGTAPYTYAWSGPSSFTASTEDITGLPTGVYAVTITDANACTVSYPGQTISQPAALSASISASTNNSCYGSTTGSATVTATGGIGTLTYSWNTTPIQTTATASNLAAGSYTVTVTDANSCTTTASVTITEPTQITATISSSNISCNGGSNGSITVSSAAGGSTPYEYSINGGSTWGSTTSFTGLAVSTYNVQIKDVNGCITDLDGTTNTVLTQPALLAATATSTNVLCNGSSTGTITVTATGGTAPYTYSTNGTTFVSTSTLTGLSAGSYTVTVKDANNCTVQTTTLTITQPSTALSVVDDGISPASCSNVSDGAIPITASGGTAPYTYSWTGPNGFTSTTQDQFYNLASGTYAVVVTDANSCTVTLSGLVITAPTPVSLAMVSSTNVTCYQGTNGAIDVSATGGTTPYGYQWEKDGVNYATTQDLTNIGAGIYDLTFTDGNFCQQTLPSITITEGPQLTATVASNASSVCSGTNAVFTITGAVGDVVTYNINGGSNTTATIASGGTATVTVNAVTIAQTINLVSVLSGSCSNTISGTASITINSLPTANAGADQSVCAGVQVTLSGAGAGTYSWNNSVTNGVAFTTSNATSAPITTTYTLTVTDANGCTATDQVDVTVTPTPDVTAITNQVYCNSTVVAQTQVTSSTSINGTIYAWTNSNTAIGLGASGSGNIPSFTATNTGTTPISATITVTPSTGACSGTPVTFTITIQPTPTVDQEPNVVYCGGVMQNPVIFTGSTANTQYAWSSDNNVGFFNGPGIANPALGGGYVIDQPVQVIATVTVTPQIVLTTPSLTCSGSVMTFTVTQNPTPQVTDPSDQILCAGSSTTAVNFTNISGTVAGATYAWTNSNTAIGLSASGTGNIQSFVATNSGSTVETATIDVTPSLNGCSGTTESFTITVNPTPTVNNFTNQTVCAGSSNAAVVPAGTVTGTTYSWTNSNPAIGLAASGTGTIPTFTAVNAGTTAITSTVTVTPATGGLSGTVFGAVAENSTLVLTAPAGTFFTGVQFASFGTPTGTAGNYTIGSCHSNTSTSVVSNLALGQTTVSIYANGSLFGDPCPGVGKRLAVVLTYGTGQPSCSGTSKTYTITVNPTPVVANKTATICSGTAFTATTGGSDVVPAGTQYTWTVAPNANVTGASNQATAVSSIGQTLTNTSNTVQTVVYTVTPISGTCSGATFTVTVTVNPTPSVAAQAATICSGAAFSVAPTNGSGNIVPTGTTYSWSAPAAITGISGLASGTAQTTIGGSLTNSTNAPINVTYVVTPTSGSCTGSSFNVVVTVNPVPAIANMTATVCSGSAFTAAPVNVTNGVVPANTTYTWTVAPNANVTGETAVSTASNNISQTLTNTTVNAELVTYTVTPTAGICAGSTFSVAVTVNPIPVIANKTATICSGTAFTVSPTTAGSDLVPTGTTYTWTVAANANVTGESSQAVAQSSISQNLVNATSAVETVVYTVTPTFGGCTGATFTVTVTVNPTPQITAQTNNACSGVAVTLAPANGGGNVVPTGTTYTWTVVDNPNVVGETNANTAQNSIVQTLVNAYTSAQQVVYTVTPSFNGCVGTPFTYTVTVSTPVTVAALTGATNVCLGSTTQLASATAGGVWTSSNTAVATVSSTGVVSGLTAGSTTISYTVTNSVGCTGVVTANVNVNALPVATITPSGATTFCQGGSVTLTASAGASYLWSNGLQTQAITVNTAGNYSVQVFNAAGCVTTSSAVAVVVNALPTATITAGGSTTFCQGGSVTLTASAGSSYLWSNGATTQSITATTSGCYSVTVTNANGCSATSACTQVTVNALPVATISSLNGNSFCQGGSVTLVSTPGSNYAWSNGLQTQSINVTASANLTVTVTNANGCFATSAPFAVTMNALPTAVITAGGPTTFCQGGSVVLTATGGTSYTWSNSTSTSNTLTVSTPGIYTVTATNANGCTATSAPVTVTVNALPVVAAIAGANDVCVGSTSILTNATPSGVWTSSNAAVATVSATGTVSGLSAGSATINYTVTNASGCVTTTSMLVNVNAVPVNIPIGGPNTVCVGATITNFATPGGVWASSNVSVATVAQNGIITGVGAGTATISYTITNAAGCSNTVTKVVTVNALPTVAVAANGPLTFCQGGSVTLTASGGTSYAWDNSTITTPARTITTSGTYTVTVTNANGCFATSAPVVVNVLALPNAAIASTGSTICLGNTVTLTASGGVSYAWSNGAQTAATTVNNSNTYTVTVTGANGCTNTASNVVTVNANPAVVTTANGPLTFCQGGSVTLNATGAASYIWSNGTLGSSNIITQSGTYYVQGTNAAGCTSNSAVVTVTVLPTPVVAALTGSNTVCEASTITLSSATPGGVWTSSNGFVATVNNSGVVTGMNAGTATITYTLSNGACNSSVSASVTVLNSPATPVITAAGPTTVCPGETVTLFSSNAPNYQWNSGQQTNGIVVTQSGTYDITVTGSNGCAVTSLPITVTIGDDVAPIIVAPLNVNVNPNLGCTAVGVALGTPVVSDNCTVASVTNNAPGLFPIGTTTVTWTVTDGAGNTATATQLVNVVDQIAPEATAPANVTVNTNNFCDATGVNLGTPEATDNCTIASIVNDAPASFPIGTTVVTWTITDATGNFTTVTQNVTVVDTEAPVVVLQSAAVQLDANGVGVLTFAAIDNGSSDNCGIAEVTIDQTTFDCGQVGFNTVTVTITDNSGNQSEAQVIINVIASDACGGADVAGPNVPDAFTPNGNSINDTWVIPGLEGYNTKEMAVYSRYGTLVYYSGAYANDWDGTLMGNGVAVPDGTYYYTLTLDGGKQLSGYVYINRVKQ